MRDSPPLRGGECGTSNRCNLIYLPLFLGGVALEMFQLWTLTPQKNATLLTRGASMSVRTCGNAGHRGMPPPEPVTTGNWCPAKPMCRGTMPHPIHGKMGSGVLCETRVPTEVAPSAQRAHKISEVPGQVAGPGHHTALATRKRQARDSPIASSTKPAITPPQLRRGREEAPPWTTTRTKSKPEREKQLGVPSPKRRSEESSKPRTEPIPIAEIGACKARESYTPPHGAETV